MLKNKYQEILVGMGIMSLVRGIISLRRNRSTLLIDDERFKVDSHPGLFLSELEVLSFLRLAKKYDIPELGDIRQFLAPATVEFVTKERRLHLGASPLENFKEMLRKFPELLDPSDYDQLYGEHEEEFRKYFLSELSRYEALAHEGSLRPKSYRFELQGPKWLRVFYLRFGELLNKEYEQSKSLKYQSLLHLLGLSHEEKLKTSLGAEEIPYYFFRTFSPIYRLQDFFLSTQLKRRLVLLGGDYKESTVQYWQFHENKFENLLLASFEGVISGERVLFFSHLPEDVSFHVTSPFGLFRTTQLTPVKRISSPFPPSNLTYFADVDLMGSERPHRVLARGGEFAFYEWPYLELPGSKAEFYAEDLNAAFASDSASLPFKAGPTEVTPSNSVTLDMRSLKADKKYESPILQQLPLEITSEEHPIKGFEYWGPFRYRSLGVLALSYGIEGI
ncbi:MAG: hypothetical protein ACLGHN_06900 [Bacteriovoracia bacterium]